MTARLARIVIFRIKSLDGMEAAEARIGPTGGLAGDREFAIVDQQCRWVNGKRTPVVQQMRSAFWKREVTLDGALFHLDRDRPALEDWLSARLEMPVQLRQDTAAGFPDDTDSRGPTLVSTATLATVGEWFGVDLGEVRRRFRANLEIDGVPPFWEDRLFGRSGTTVPFQVGEVVIEGNNPCARCAVPSRNSWTGAVTNPAFAARFAQFREKHLPDWAERTRFDHFYRLALNTKVPASERGKLLRVGDPVAL